MPIDLTKLPRHVAIIMDGNGRWAQEHGLPRVEGHRQGAKAVREVVRAAREINLRALTLYAFSAQNWQRPPDEVATLMQLLRDYVIEERDEIMENDIRLIAIGDVDRLHIIGARIDRGERLDEIGARRAEPGLGAGHVRLGRGAIRQPPQRARRLAHRQLDELVEHRPSRAERDAGDADGIEALHGEGVEGAGLAAQLRFLEDTHGDPEIRAAAAEVRGRL